MSTRRFRALALATAPLGFVACAFVLDFDELEDGGDVDRIGFGGASSVASGGEGATNDANIGGSSGGSVAGQAGAAPGAGGGAGSGGGESFDDCRDDCDDGDPCTRDFCDTSQEPPECGHEVREGVFEDGFVLSLTAQKFHRITMVAGADEFYLSAFRSVDGDTETTLYSLPRSDENFVERFRASELGEGLPISAMGLAVDVSDGSTLHGYVALVDDVDGANPRVSHLRFDDLSSPTSTVAGLGYPTDRPDRYPKAFVVDDAVHGAWIDLDGSITMQAASGETITFNSAPGVPARATSFAPIASASTPGVLFSRVRGTVIQELRGGAQVQLEQCLTGVDDFLTMRSVPIGDPGAWLVGWTASTQGNFATESRLLVCSDDAGCLPQPCDVGDTVWPNVRHAAEALMALDAGGFVLATALPSLDAGQAALTLQVRRVDYGEVAVDEPVVETLDEFEVSSLPAGAGLEGPDWPALSFLPPGKLALSWLEPESGQGVTALRVRRYDVCLGAD